MKRYTIADRTATRFFVKVFPITLQARQFDGTTCWAPTEAQRVDGSNYLILNNYYFDEEDIFILPEFIPGDIVELVEHQFVDETRGLLARMLLKSSDNSKKKLFEFLFKATKQTLPIDIGTIRDYFQQIQFVKERQLEGDFFHPSILATVKKFEELKFPGQRL